MSMNDPRAMMNEHMDIIEALCNWFISQEISPGRAVAVMSLLSGIMAAEAATSQDDALAKLQTLSVISKLTCIDAMSIK